MSELNRRQFLQASGAGLAASAGAAAAARPNVLLIMTDQHRWDALGCYGNDVIRTPHVDNLAAGGVRFTECWAQHPACMPSRASLFTGRYPSVHGVRTNGVPLPRSETTMANAFADSGYRTGGAGKFHLIPHYPYGSPLPTMDTHPDPYYGFQEFHLGEDGRSGEHWMWIRDNHPAYHKKPDHEIPVELHNSYWSTSHTIDFMRESVQAGQPFFKVVDGYTQQIDVFPTLAELAGLPPTPGVQGCSQTSVLTSDSGDTGYDSILIEFAINGETLAGVPDTESPDLYTIRTAEWRLSYYPGSRSGELFNLQDDPTELHNRWADPKLDSVRRDLKDHLLDRVLQARDPLPVRENRY